MTHALFPTEKTATLPEIGQFDPVPRLIRCENGWTPARQRAFIEALAETASVRRAAMMVNMSKVSCYHLRKHPQGESFRKAWDAAVDAGIAHLKDIAFERAVEGQLEPVWQAGKLVGHKRKYSDNLLMFLLRQYGSDSDGKRVTVNYVRTRAAVTARGGEAAAGAEAEATTMTVRSSKPPALGCISQERAAETITEFAGVTLDATAHAEIANTLNTCAASQREIAGSYDDPEQPSFTAHKNTPLWLGNLEPPFGWVEDTEPFDPAEPGWQSLGEERDLDAGEAGEEVGEANA
jgi:hypothetical protein